MPSTLSLTISLEQQQAIVFKLAHMVLPAGLGDVDNACSIAAINLALTGELKDDVPLCMSEVIGRWIIVMQDAMPSPMRNSDEWKRLLPLAAGTGRKKEQERIAAILKWMWETVLPILQPIAEKQGFGDKWRIMSLEQTAKAASAAADAAAAAALAAAAADAAAAAALAAAAAAAKAALLRRLACFYAAADAADAARAFANTAAGDHSAWELINPCGLLEKLIFI